MAIAESGDGYVSLIDADRYVVRSYDISSETYSLSYSLPGANLFRGNSHFQAQVLKEKYAYHLTYPTQMT